MGKYFTMEELTYSATANLKKIKNVPNGAVKKNLEILIEQLDKIREKYGKPIYVNSGYRCEKLNTVIKGVSNSQHMLGCAVDITTKNTIEDRKLYEMITTNFDYDQCLWEEVGGAKWIHYSYLRPNRKQKFTIRD